MCERRENHEKSHMKSVWSKDWSPFTMEKGCWMGVTLVFPFLNWL